MKGFEWPEEVKQRALALCLLTGNISEASRQLRSELGNQPAPPTRTVNLWVHHGDPELYQTIANNKRAIIQERWLDVELAALDEIEGMLEEGKVEAKDAAVVAGISADKRIAIETLMIRYKGGNRSGLLRMMERIEQDVRGGKTTTRIVETVAAEGEMP